MVDIKRDKEAILEQSDGNNLGGHSYLIVKGVMITSLLMLSILSILFTISKGDMKERMFNMIIKGIDMVVKLTTRACF